MISDTSISNRIRKSSRMYRVAMKISEGLANRVISGRSPRSMGVGSTGFLDEFASDDFFEVPLDGRGLAAIHGAAADKAKIVSGPGANTKSTSKEEDAGIDVIVGILRREFHMRASVASLLVHIRHIKHRKVGAATTTIRPPVKRG